MKVNVRDIRKSERLEVCYDIQPQALEPYLGEDVAVGTDPLRVEGELQSSGDDVVGRFNVKGRVQLSCARCLAPVPYRIDAGFWVVFRRSSSVVDGACEEDEDIVEFDEDEIDLDDVVLQNTALSVPMKVLCRSDCRGIEWRG